MDAQQELFTRLLTDLRSKGYDVYDGFLPSEDTPYPFIYLSDSRQTDRMTKTNLTGIVYQTIDVWGNSPKNRGTISNILQDIFKTPYQVNHMGFCWFFLDTVRKTQQLLLVIGIRFLCQKKKFQIVQVKDMAF